MNDLSVICVDDEPRILEGLENVLGWDHHVITFESGEAALDYLREGGANRVAVFISDMRMPGMDGATLLSRVASEFPNIVRMLLTGYSDVESALRAINEGKIFRMLMKPVEADELNASVLDAMRQYELLQSERVLLEGTLRGAIGALMEALSLASPLAMSRAKILESMMTHIGRVKGEDLWEYETAAFLALLGTIASPNSVLEKFAMGAKLDAGELSTIEEYPDIGFHMLHKIPRLERVAEIVRHHATPGWSGDPFIQEGAERLRTCLAFDQRRLSGLTSSEVMDELKVVGHRQDILNALSSFRPPDKEMVMRQVDLAQLLPGMCLNGDVMSKVGQLLIRKDTVLSRASIERLRNFDRGVGVTTPITVSLEISTA